MTATAAAASSAPRGGGGGGPKKSRFDGLDVAAMTTHVRRTLLGFKVANVYDGTALAAGSLDSASSNRATYVFKLANPSGGAASADAAARGGAAAAAAAESGGSGKGEQQQQQPSGTNSNSNRAMLLIESGVRFHPTTFASSSTTDARSMPSPFASKLRKHLRNLRLENATQLGNLDRVVDFRFGSGTAAHHVILELYAQGNVILTDAEYRILALLRTMEYEAKSDATATEKDEEAEAEVKVRVGNVYPVTYATSLRASAAVADAADVDAATDVRTAANGGGDVRADGHDGHVGDGGADTPTTATTTTTATTAANAFGLLSMDGRAASEWAQKEMEAWARKSAAEEEEKSRAQQGGKGGGKGKQGKKKRGSAGQDGSISLKSLLLKPTSGVYHYGPSLIEHCILTAKLAPNLKVTADDMESVMPESAWSGLVGALRDEGSAVINRLTGADGDEGGYVLYRPKQKDTAEAEGRGESADAAASAATPSTAAPHSDKVFEEFQPHLLAQHAHRPHIRYATFADAVDEFFSLIEGQRRALRADAAEAAARDKLDKIRRDQAGRVERLEREMEVLREHAQLVEANASDVDKALTVLNSAMDTGMDWEALESLVAVEQRNGNPIALLVKELDLAHEAVVLALPDTLNHDGTDGEPIPRVDVKISLTESAFGNAKDLFEKYRASKDKSQKTIEASTKALRAAEAAAQRQLEEAQKRKLMTTVVPQRKQHWFEKFNWFITSDNYLVLGGRDAQQNEQLVKRYLRPGDAYLHADVHGAASVVLRAKRRRTAGGKTEVLPLSDQALREAGNFTICRSSAWSSRMVTSAWWVESHQVSKTAPTGEYLTVGSFMIRGKKNFLPASQLEMGIGVLFRLGDEASVARHVNDRRDFALLERESSLASQEEKEEVPWMETKVELQEQFSEEAQESEDHEGPNEIVQEEKAEAIETETLAVKDAVSEERQGEVSLESPADLDRSSSSLRDEDGEALPPLRKKKGLSVRDRRLMKRYQSLTASDKLLVDKTLEEEARAAIEADQAMKTKPKKTETPKQEAPVSRGKKAKAKRAAKKYADQDEEDRELAMLALHGGEKKSKKKGKGSRPSTDETSIQRKAASDAAALLMRDASEVAAKLPEEVRDALASSVTVKVDNEDDGKEEVSVRWDKFDADVLEQMMTLPSSESQLAAANRLLDLSRSTRVDNFSASLAGIIRAIKKYGHENFSAADDQDGSKSDGKQRKTKAEKKAEKEAWREILREDGIVDEDVDSELGEIDDRAELSKLTGSPHTNDVLLYAVPICAPYQTLAKYKYRVKLTPGSQKRGKASKQCVEMFLRSDTDKSVHSNRLREFIKVVGENEWVQAILGDVKISGPSASKVAKKQKANQKKGGKKRK